MSRVLTSQSAGAAIYVFSDDHCRRTFMLVIVATELVDNETNDVSHKSMGRCAGGREAGKIEVSAGPLPNAKQIAAAIYDPDVELLRVIFKDNTTENVSTRR